ncbi:helix-turn-helix domain-containing protein [Kibdelosporangium persicum]|uniref:MarR family transcriptional regulator n=1 Tax=Kibdelosporangium persicum TaxID=2698649 RepID=A0ABX2F6U7_9PSEU|nr:helix-turn-helix domain-containing protein [Kibdelosporangium persicum]NRN66918.1 MarR family transcriptional regulator [Kibdelosporangium persicum]
MPGGRLTQEDRQDIAAGLADGLSYAEIAHRLGRPTSTISREVARNGGGHRYRARQAQRATAERARRGKSRRAATPRPDLCAHGRDPQAVDAFSEEFIDLAVKMGLPRMTAKVLGCLYTTDSGSITAAELVHRLRVSPASISAAVKSLEEQELITRVRDPGQRRDRYVIDDDVWYRAMLASARINATMAEKARQGAEILGATTPAGQRLRDVGEFLERVYEDSVRAAEHWRAIRTKATR